MLLKDRCFIWYNINFGMFVFFIGVEIWSVCIEVGMFVIRVWRKMVIEKDFLEVVNKVIKVYVKFSFIFRYMIYN